MNCPHCGKTIAEPQTDDRRFYLEVLLRYATPLGLSLGDAQERRWPKAFAARLFAYRELAAEPNSWSLARIGRAAGRDHTSIRSALMRAAGTSPFAPTGAA